MSRHATALAVLVAALVLVAGREGDEQQDVLAKNVVAAVSESTGVTVLMTRNRVGVVCPGVDGDSMATACLGGRCVEERCTPETLEFARCRSAARRRSVMT